MFKLQDFLKKRRKAGELTRAADNMSALENRISQLNLRSREPLPILDRTVETRAEVRFKPKQPATYFSLKGEKKKYDARILNVSMHAVAIDADFSQVRAEDIVSIGAQPVAHVRNLRRGAVFEFIKPLDLAQCNADLIL